MRNIHLSSPYPDTTHCPVFFPYFDPSYYLHFNQTKKIFPFALPSLHSACQFPNKPFSCFLGPQHLVSFWYSSNPPCLSHCKLSLIFCCRPIMSPYPTPWVISCNPFCRLKPQYSLCFSIDNFSRSPVPS